MQKIFYSPFAFFIVTAMSAVPWPFSRSDDPPPRLRAVESFESIHDEVCLKLTEWPASTKVMLEIRQQLAPFGNMRQIDAELDRKGINKRVFMFNLVANTACDLIESGVYHVCVGVMNPLYQAEPMIEWVWSELKRLGEVDDAWIARNRATLKGNIRSAG